MAVTYLVMSGCRDIPHGLTFLDGCDSMYGYGVGPKGREQHWCWSGYSARVISCMGYGVLFSKASRMRDGCSLQWACVFVLFYYEGEHVWLDY